MSARCSHRIRVGATTPATVDVDDGYAGTPGRFASLAIPEFRRLWWGGVFVFLAMQTQQIARSWLAYELTGTNTALGGVLIGFGVAGLVAIPTGVFSPTGSRSAPSSSPPSWSTPSRRC